MAGGGGSCDVTRFNSASSYSDRDEALMTMRVLNTPDAIAHMLAVRRQSTWDTSTEDVEDMSIAEASEASGASNRTSRSRTPNASPVRASRPALSLVVSSPTDRPGSGVRYGSARPLMCVSAPQEDESARAYYYSEGIGSKPSSRPGSGIRSHRPSSGMSSRPSSATSSISMRDSFVTRPMSQRRMVAMYDKILSPISVNEDEPPMLFLGADAVARDAAVLREAGVSHIVNCAGLVCANHHEDSFAYLRLNLLDSTREDISATFYDALEFIHAAVEAKSKVFVHCQHGVSRSATIVIAYLMWSQSLHYEEVLDIVREKRPTINPNIGFACALLQWGSTLGLQHTESPPLQAWALTEALCEENQTTVSKWSFRPIASGADEPYVVASVIEKACVTDCFLLQRGGSAACWYGQHAPQQAHMAVETHVARLCRFHRLPADAPLLEVKQGEEPDELWDLLGIPHPNEVAPGGSTASGHEAVPIPASFGATGVPETPKCGRCKRSFGNFGKSTWSADSGTALAEVSEDETGSSLLALQMATTALQSVVSELLLAVESVCEQQDDESGDEASSPKATQLKKQTPNEFGIDVEEIISMFRDALVRKPTMDTECADVQRDLNSLVEQLHPALLSLEALAPVVPHLASFSSRLPEINGAQLLEEEEAMLTIIREASGLTTG